MNNEIGGQIEKKKTSDILSLKDTQSWRTYKEIALLTR